jgi:PAS domain S-box-containing protein
MSPHFDLHTMFVICSSLSVASCICMVMVQLTGRLYPGFGNWTIAVLGQAVGFTLYAYSQDLPPLVGSMVGNLFYTLYPMFTSRGFRAFAGRRTQAAPIALCLLYTLGTTYYFSVVHLSPNWRVACGQLVVMPFFIESAILVWRDPAFRYPIVRPWITGTFILMVVSGLTRMALMFVLEPNRLQIWAPSGVQPYYITLLTGLTLSVSIGVIVLNFLRAAANLEEKERLLTEDVIARKKVEAALRESETRYRSLVETSPESVTVHREGIVIYANPSAVKMFGAKSAADLIGRPFLDRISPEFHAVALKRRKKIKEQGIGGPLAEMRYLKIDGSSFEVETQSVPILYDGEPATQITSHDISLLKRAAAERKEFERKLQETQKLESLGVLAGGIAHDFNNILTGILGNASLARIDLPDHSPADENLRSIIEGSQRAADLCRQMLAYSGKGTFVVRNLSLNRLVHDTAHLLKISISKGADLHFNLHESLPAIEADATQIRQVIMNLVINASEAIGEGGGSINLSTGLAEAEREDFVKGELTVTQEALRGTCVFLEVADSGIGMDAETKAKIFDPFFTTKFTGRGLGLAAVLGIVRGHKGALRIDSAPGKGTTFRIYFPIAKGAVEADAAVPNGNVTWHGRGSVLVVDDEETVRNTAALMLRKLGFDVTMVADGREAVEAFEKEPSKYSVVLMDLTMPHLCGERAFEQLRQIRADVGILLMSGFNEHEAASRFAGKPLSSFIQKPFRFDELSSAVHGILDQVSASRMPFAEITAGSVRP